MIKSIRQFYHSFSRFIIQIIIFWYMVIKYTLTFTTLWAFSAKDKLMIFFLFFPKKQDLTFHANCLQICIKHHILFPGKNKKNISKCRLLKILPRVLSIKAYETMHDKTHNKTCGTSKDSDQPAHPRSLIRISADSMCLLLPPGCPKRDKQEPLPYRAIYRLI